MVCTRWSFLCSTNYLVSRISSKIHHTRYPTIHHPSYTYTSSLHPNHPLSLSPQTPSQHPHHHPLINRTPHIPRKLLQQPLLNPPKFRTSQLPHQPTHQTLQPLHRTPHPQKIRPNLRHSLKSKTPQIIPLQQILTSKNSPRQIRNFYSREIRSLVIEISADAKEFGMYTCCCECVGEKIGDCVRGGEGAAEPVGGNAFVAEG